MKKPLIFILIGVIFICGILLLVLVGKNVTTDISKSDQADQVVTTAETENNDFADYEEIDISSLDQDSQILEFYAEAISLLAENLANGWTEYAPADAGLSAAFSDTSLQFAYYMEDLNGDGYDELLLGIQEGASFKIVQFVTADESGLTETLFTGNKQRYLVALQDGIYAEYGFSTEFVIGQEEPDESDGKEQALTAVAAWTFTDGVLTETDLPESLKEKAIASTPIN